MERYNTLDAKLDSLREDISEVKSDVKTHIETTRIHMDIIKEHIAGDKKIINTIEPLIKELPDLVAIVKEYQFEKEAKRRHKANLIVWTKRLTFLAAFASVAKWVKELIQY